MNIPGVPESNWRVRTTAETLAGIDKAYYKEINRLYRRDGGNSFLRRGEQPAGEEPAD